MKTPTYKNGARVLIHHVENTGREFPANICGIAMDCSAGVFYIVRLAQPRDLRPNYAYDCIIISEACLKPEPEAPMVEIPVELSFDCPICLVKVCPYRGSCANHETAGDFRIEDGLSPRICQKEDKWFCTQDPKGRGVFLLE